MPSKYVIKTYVTSGFYHIFNRGVNKQRIFREEQDYYVFLNYLRNYLIPLEKIKKQTDREVYSATFHDTIELISYCLMPNHYHLFIKQYKKRAMAKFMKALQVKYIMYFNNKYARVGPLFQSKYKAVMVETEPQFLYLTRYIHRNPIEILKKGQQLREYKFSSYPMYLKRHNTEWISTKDVLHYFKKSKLSNQINNYKNFVEGYEPDELSQQAMDQYFIDL